MSRRGWFAAALAVALAQLALAIRCGAVTFYGPLALGWGAALLIAHERRDSPISASPLAWIPGALLALAPFAWLARPDYGALDRAAPLVSGAGLLLFAGGLRGRGRELLLLSLPLISPFPQQLAHAVAPLRSTAVFATLFLRAVGVPAVIDGQVIAFSGTGIAVIEPCTGLEQLSQLLALSLVVLCFFRTSTAQKIAVPLVALACGFLVNAARVAAIGILVRDRPSLVDLWDGTGLYAPVFSAFAAALTCLAWWPLLRAPPGRPLRTSAVAG
ncbi:MAG TPA: archaeosortase/exosortase family protein [Myxococcales bacterium]